MICRLVGLVVCWFGYNFFGVLLGIGGPMCISFFGDIVFDGGLVVAKHGALQFSVASLLEIPSRP